MKQKILAVCMVLIGFSIVAGRSLTYFTAQTAAHNVVTTGAVELVLKEEFPPGGVFGVCPEDRVSKRVWVENTGTAAAWVRIGARLEICGPQGETLPELLPDGSPAVSWQPLPGWTRGEDGNYYYGSVLEPGEKTSDLMEKVVFNAKMGNEYQGGRVSLDLTAYGVQSRNNGSTVMQAQGWPEKRSP